MNEIIADRYARALFEVARKNGKVEEYYRDLSYILQHLDAYELLEKVIFAASIPPPTKRNILRDLFTGRINQDVLNFLYLLVDKNREEYLKLIVASYEEKLNEMKNIVTAVVVTAVEPMPDFISKIETRVSALTGKKARISVRVDPEIIGGFQIIIKDRLLDYSIRGQLNRIGKKICELPGCKV